MGRDPRHDILFEPIAIGPVTARNRFYQVPHCNGMGYRYPRATAAMRAVKAEGGWSVVCTEECEIHPSGDVSPHVEARLWDDRDIPIQAAMTAAVHEHGALAGVELAHNGLSAGNLYSREVPLGPSHHVVLGSQRDPVQARAMDRSDIRAFRRWHREGALRARRAGFDVIYVYAGHNLTLPMHFLSRRFNRRTDEYGGSLENRVRLLRELIEDTKEAVGDTCAVAVRFAVDELLGASGIECEGEGREVVEILAELPDLWDVNLSEWDNDSQTSRFAQEGYQEPFVAFVKRVTSKPVVGVGRFTSPDAMVGQIRRGVLDFIGAARPSIADPFLPKKVEEGRLEDIRECIGCNICVSGDFRHVPIRCTQNPTMGEEWRRGWHPERIAPKRTDETVLVVGAGPAGLECARALGRRGYPVILAEAREDLGGRVTDESGLPGLAEWARVRDYREQQLLQLPNVEVYRASRMTASDVLELGSARVVLAVGSRWRRDGVGHEQSQPIPIGARARVFTPEDIVARGAVPDPVLVFDDDHYYLGGVIAQMLRDRGLEVTLVTPAVQVSHWTHNTMEQYRIQSRLMSSGVHIVVRHNLVGIEEGSVRLECGYTHRAVSRACESVVLITSRLPEENLYHDLQASQAALDRAGIKTVDRIGDCLAPSTIAAAVYAGHRYAQCLDEPECEGSGFRREMPGLDSFPAGVK